MADDVEVRFNHEALTALLSSSGVARDLERRAINVERRAKTLASTPGAGRTYTRGRVTHRASAPGDPPAVDTGQLRASITHQLGTDSAGLFALVGSNLRKALWLELGTSRMAARPFLRPALPAARE